ncbi:sodium:solute symporter [Flavobacterium noncentrifugens]|uniref:Na+/proline symporter n=1 Tax=Flavobacterium noncentrifugens TaxID=1128970 RepID=A0A1G8WGN4_9FLAO|nr:sodium:solute symporter family protein [Flavobacterium noncentrifugens]GEP50921.1 sodium:solute symporter [Flavobacterium noncentrifugens]SDJ77346.1 Na+/proline symporter [Flavobacterium noncentrifugens]
MKLSTIDLIIIGAYFLLMIVIGLIMKNRAKKSKDNYLMAGKKLPWYMLGLSDASDMFDISGTMLLVSMAFLYGFKSVWIPWMWPVFNQVFLMVFLSKWLRRSNATTGAEWLGTRFGLTDKGVRQSHAIVVVFALMLCIGYMAYAFVGVGEFLEIFIPYESIKEYVPFLDKHLELFLPGTTDYETALFAAKNTTAQFYGISICIVATFYSIVGGMHGIVLADFIKYMIMIFCSIFVGIIAMTHLANSGIVITDRMPLGWDNPLFGKELGLDWSQILGDAQVKLQKDGYKLFSAIVSMMFFSGVLKSLAGPAPNYDCQKILSTKSPEEASKMSGFISIILLPIRYFMTMGLCILGVLYFKDLNLHRTADGVNFENIMPAVINNYLPVGLVGLVLAGFLGAFMSNFSGTLNAGQAYIVNDIYLKFFNPDAPRKKVINVGYISGIVMVCLGVGLGLLIKDVNMIFNIITAGLYGGFVCANVLKWYWWRFNANGYFYGMLAGIIASAIPPALSVSGVTTFFDGTRMLYFFPVFIIIQLIACIIGSYAAPATNTETLIEFYKTVRPWGFWKPIHEIALAENPGLERNKNFKVNMLNIVLGIAGQILLTLLPMYLILSKWNALGVVIALLSVIVFTMRKTWWQCLSDY